MFYNSHKILTMPTPFLFALVTLIWGSSWIAITYQYGAVSEELSVAYRFFIAAIFLFSYALIKKEQLRINLSHYPMIILMGSSMFCLNYLFTYYGMNYVESGLAAVLFGLIVIFNAFFERIFFGKIIEKWNLPSILVEAVQYHHCPDKARISKKLTYIVHLADAISCMLGIGLGCDGLMYVFEENTLDVLGLSKEEVESIMCELVDKVFGTEKSDNDCALQQEPFQV